MKAPAPEHVRASPLKETQMTQKAQAGSARTGRHGVMRAVALGVMLGMMASPLAAQGVVSAQEQSAVSRARLDGMMTPFGMALALELRGDGDLAAVYADRDWQPLFTAPEAGRQRAALFAALDRAGDHGLPVARYDAPGLRAGFASLRTEHDRVALELAMMRAFLSYGRDVSSGLLNPRQADYGIKRRINRPDPVALARNFAVAPAPEAVLRDLLPKDPLYTRLLVEKLRIEEILKRPDLLAETRAKAARPGDRGAAVVALRARLQALGFLGRSAQAVYDDDLRAAVRAFQTGAGLAADGVAGPGTVRALNRDPADRLGAILVTMERLRWMRGIAREGRYVWVNIPEFNVRVMEGDRELFRSVTVVGKDDPESRTPEFSEAMTHMVVNPAWNVPRSITVKEYLPRLQENPGALAYLEVVGRGGKVIPRDQVDFSAYTAQNFPYRLRQPPAERNALGEVKFMFPNPWNIYLHDTPSKEYFQRSSRMYSHGCVRVGSPVALAEALLAPQVGNARAAYRNARAREGEQVIHLKPAIPVHLVYFTLWPDGKGGFRRFPDVYGRDARVRRALVKAGVEFAGGRD